MWSASRPCPHASWNRIPPVPLLITTGRTPDGAGRAASLVRARRAACARGLLDGEAVEQLEAEGAARATRSPSACRCRPRRRTSRKSASGPGRRRPAGRRSWRRGCGAGCRRSRRTPGRSSRSRRVRRRRPAGSSSTLVAFGTLSGADPTVLGEGTSRPSSATVRTPGPPAAGDRGGGLGRGEQAPLRSGRRCARSPWSRRRRRGSRRRGRAPRRAPRPAGRRGRSPSSGDPRRRPRRTHRPWRARWRASARWRPDRRGGSRSRSRLLLAGAGRALGGRRADVGSVDSAAHRRLLAGRCRIVTARPEGSRGPADGPGP